MGNYNGRTTNFFNAQEREFIYEMYCNGYTKFQLAECFSVCEKTIERALYGKPRIRPSLSIDDYKNWRKIKGYANE